MTKNVYRIMAIPVALAGFGLIVGLAGCCSFKPCPQGVIIVGLSESEAVFTNAEASFSVNAVHGPPFTSSGLTYQWQVNKYLLDPMNPDAYWTNYTGVDATNSTITISHVQLTDVGYYRVLVSAGGNTVTSAAPCLQAFTLGSIDVNGTPIAGSVGNYCPAGTTVVAYIPYTNCPKCGRWGWAVANTANPITATDTLHPGDNSKVGYWGCYGDADCGANGSTGTVTKQPPFALPTGSPRYQFTLYFTVLPIPTERPYPLHLDNLQ